MTNERVSDERLAEIAGDGSPNFAIGKGDFNEFRRICRELQSLRSAREAEPVGEAGPMPGSNGGFTMAAFKADAVPLGSKLYLHPALSTSAEQVITDEMVERARHAHADARDFGWDYVAAMRAALTAALSPIPDNQVEG